MLCTAYRDAADQLGLKRVPPEGSSEDLFSIWDGSKFVFKSSPWSLISLWRLISRYWLMYFKFRAPHQMLQKFLRLYDLQRQGQSFETPEAFLKELDLYDLTQQSMQDYLNVSYAVPYLCTCASPVKCMQILCETAVKTGGWHR